MPPPLVSFNWQKPQQAKQTTQKKKPKPVRRTAVGAVATVVLATVLGFASCEEPKRSEAGLYDVHATRACMKESHPFRKRELTGWLDSTPKDEADERISILMSETDVAKTNAVELLFFNTRNAAKAEYRRVAEQAQLAKEEGFLDRVLQRRANVVFVWNSPETTQQQIASVMRCLRRRSH